MNRTVLTPCLKGYHSANDRLSCVACEKGFYCPSDKMDAGIACNNGTYQDQIGQQSCLTCPAGSRCPAVDLTPVACTNGTFSLLGDVDCQTCPAGHR